MARPMSRGRVGLAWLLAWAALVAPAWAGLDRSIEKMMGRDARAAIESQYRLLQTPAVLGFVDRVMQRVASASPRKLTYTVRIIETDEVNAMALPSGDVYVTTGLLGFVESQDELAGVLGHEIAHVAEKHSLNSFKQQFWTGMLLGAVRMPSGVASATNLATTLYFLRYSRKDEAEADRVGARIALDAGYDPFALQSFLGRLGEAHKGRLSGVESWFTTHPEPERRVSRLGELKELDASRPATLMAIGGGYLDRHFAAQAVLRLRRAVTLAPQDPNAQLRLAQADAAAGLTDQAAAAVTNVVALDPALAKDASAIRDTDAEQSPAGPVPRDLDQRAAESVKQVEASRQAATAAAKALSGKLEALGKTRKELADRTKRLQQDLSEVARSRRMTGEQETMLRRSATVLSQIEEAVGRLGGVAKASTEGAKQADTTGGSLADELKSAPSPAARARLVELADRYVTEADKRRAENETITAQAETAMASADSAAKHLGDAMDALYRRTGVASGDNLAQESARSSLDQAEKEAKDASGAARRAAALQSEAAVRNTAWAMDMETLTLSPAENSQADAIVAGYVGADAQAVRAARRETGGLGSAALRLIAAVQPAKQETKEAKPAAPARPGDKADKPAVKPEQQAGVDLLIALMRKDVKREIEAAKRVAADPQAQEPLPPKPPEPVPVKPAGKL